MKILIQNPIEPILEGIAQVLSSIGETLIIWDTKIPLNDLLDKYEPELVICYTGSIKDKLKSKLVLIDHAGENFDPNIVDLVCTSITDMSSKQKRYINNCKTNNKYLYIETAANLAYHVTEYDDKYATDLFYYSQNTTPDILEYLLEIEKNYQLKIIGQHRIPIFSYLGVGTSDDIVKFMKSCKIALAFDLSTLYTYAANKTFCLTNQNTQLYPDINEQTIYPQFTNFLDLNTQINFYLSNNQTISNIVDQAYTYIISEHTYFHRTHEILTRLGYNDLAHKCLTHLQQIIEQNE